MTNVFSSIEYPHWLIVAGAALLMLGFVGLALRRRAVEAEPSAVASDQKLFEPEAEHAPEADRTAKEMRRDRWAERAAPISSETCRAEIPHSDSLPDKEELSPS